MRDAKGAVDTTTVLQRRIAGAIVLIVARVTHIVGAKAAEEGNVAAIHALPVNLLFAMNLAIVLSFANIDDEAVLAE